MTPSWGHAWWCSISDTSTCLQIYSIRTFVLWYVRFNEKLSCSNCFQKAGAVNLLNSQDHSDVTFHTLYVTTSLSYFFSFCMYWIMCFMKSNRAISLEFNDLKSKCKKHWASFIFCQVVCKCVYTKLKCSPDLSIANAVFVCWSPIKCKACS